VPEQSQPQMPAPKGGVIAYLAVDGAMKAAELYKKAFGADVAFVNPPDDKGRTMHVHLHINGSSVMLGDFYPEQGHAKVAPAAFSLMLAVNDADAWFDRAVKAGMTVAMPVQNMFWGDRYGQLKDEFGVLWAVNGPIKS
jgi:PhnB protein